MTENLKHPVSMSEASLFSFPLRSQTVLTANFEPTTVDVQLDTSAGVRIPCASVCATGQIPSVAAPARKSC